MINVKELVINEIYELCEKEDINIEDFAFQLMVIFKNINFLIAQMEDLRKKIINDLDHVQKDFFLKLLMLIINVDGRIIKDEERRKAEF